MPSLLVLPPKGSSVSCLGSSLPVRAGCGRAAAREGRPPYGPLALTLTCTHATHAQQDTTRSPQITRPPHHVASRPVHAGAHGSAVGAQHLHRCERGVQRCFCGPLSPCRPIPSAAFLLTPLLNSLLIRAQLALGCISASAWRGTSRLSRPRCARWRALSELGGRVRRAARPPPAPHLLKCAPPTRRVWPRPPAANAARHARNAAASQRRHAHPNRQNNGGPIYTGSEVANNILKWVGLG
jgi:hypothetical protein